MHCYMSDTRRCGAMWASCAATRALSTENAEICNNMDELLKLFSASPAVIEDFLWEGAAGIAASRYQ